MRMRGGINRIEIAIIVVVLCIVAVIIGNKQREGDMTGRELASKRAQDTCATYGMDAAPELNTQGSASGRWRCVPKR